MFEWPVEKRGANPVDVHVGSRLAELRRARRLSQGELGDALGITFQQVQQYERGMNRVSASRLWGASEVLGVEIGAFFAGLSRTPMRPVVAPARKRRTRSSDPSIPTAV